MKMRKIIAGLLVLVIGCALSVGCKKEEKIPDPFEGLGHEEFRVSFEQDGLVTFPTICFNEEWTKEHAKVDVMDGFEGKAFQADIKLPDPTNLWFALGIGMATTNTYEGNFKNVKKMAFKYKNTANLGANLVEDKIQLQFAIKSVKATETDEQEVYTIDKVTFPMQKTDNVQVFSVDIPADIQTKINASTKTLYLDWFMIAIENFEEADFSNGKIIIDDITFFS